MWNFQVGDSFFLWFLWFYLKKDFYENGEKNIVEENRHVILMKAMTISTQPHHVLENPDRANPK